MRRSNWLINVAVYTVQAAETAEAVYCEVKSSLLMRTVWIVLMRLQRDALVLD
jgi:hypothetical protein